MNTYVCLFSISLLALLPSLSQASNNHDYMPLERDNKQESSARSEVSLNINGHRVICWKSEGVVAALAAQNQGNPLGVWYGSQSGIFAVIPFSGEFLVCRKR